MKEDLKSRWFWLRRHPAEPVILRRYLQYGGIVTFAGLLAAVGTGVMQGLSDFETYTPEMERKALCCPEQHGWRKQQERLRTQDIEESSWRLAVLEQALRDPLSPHFALAREKTAEEERELAKLKRQFEGLQVKPLSVQWGVTATVSVALILVLASAAGHLMLRHGSKSVLETKKLESWTRPYWVFVTLMFLAFFGREVYTSVLTIEKSWFGWNSFCVSHESWSLMQVVVFGLSMAVAHPASVIWCLSRRRRLRLVATHPDGAWGVGDYVLFLQTWTIMCVVLILLPTLLLLRIFATNPYFSFVHVVPSALYLGGASVVAGRLIWNATRIRRAYSEELLKLGATWGEIQAQKPPADPTVKFLGDHWWKLPATILGAVAILWAIVELSGIIERIS